MTFINSPWFVQCQNYSYYIKKAFLTSWWRNGYRFAGLTIWQYIILVYYTYPKDFAKKRENILKDLPLLISTWRPMFFALKFWTHFRMDFIEAKSQNKNSTGKIRNKRMHITKASWKQHIFICKNTFILMKTFYKEDFYNLFTHRKP